MVDVRTGQAKQLSREAFRTRYSNQFYDPAFAPERQAIERLEAIAWDGYSNARNAPITRKAGLGYADPNYDLSVEW